MVSSRDVQEIVSKLSSDKAKAREEGIKLLNTWLEGERSIGFCKYLGQNTAKLKPNDIPHSETWPFLIKLLIQCVSLEISSSKRRLPKLVLAKTLRIVIQRAVDAKLSGKMLPLLSVVKILYSHIWDVLSNVPSFQPEYGIILRHLLAVRDYRFHMKKRIFCSLINMYMDKLETSLNEKTSSQCFMKEEVFRCILTVQSLLENPPGDFPDDLRENIVKGFVQIFYYVREEGKVSRKLIECINTYLLNDGPNLGCRSLEIHNAVQQFVFRCWLTTHDRSLKDSLVLYARLQLNLIRSAVDESSLVEQLFDVVTKELDQSNFSIPGASWSEAAKDDKFGTLSNSQCGMLELAAHVFYRVCISTKKAPSSEKRARKEHSTVILKEALMKGKWLWSAAFCCLIRNYYSRISMDLLIYWFEGICTSFERILNDANMGHAYDGLLWTLRSLQGLSSALQLSDSPLGISSRSCTSKEFTGGWQLIWNQLMHGLPTFSNVTPVVDAALMLLGSIISSDILNTYFVSQDVWELQLFKGMPSPSILYFIACYHSRKGSQGDLRDILHLRKNLLRISFASLNFKESSLLSDRMIMLLPGAVYALCAGCDPFGHCYKEVSLFDPFREYTETADDWIKMDENEQERQLEFFECSVEVLAKIDSGLNIEVYESQFHPSVCLPRQLREPLLHEMETYVLGGLVVHETEKRPLSDVFFTCALLANFIYGSFLVRRREENSSFVSKLGNYLLELLNNVVNVIQANNNDVNSLGSLGFGSNFNEKSAIVASFSSFIRCPLLINGRDQDVVFCEAVLKAIERLLSALAELYVVYNDCVKNLQYEMISSELSSSDSSAKISNHLDGNRSRIVDMELDVNEDAKGVNILTAGGEIATGISFSAEKWKLGMISLISSFLPVLHGVTWNVLFGLMEEEDEPKVGEKILYNLCQHPHWSSPAKLTDLVNLMNNWITTQVTLKLDCVNILSTICILLATLLSSDYGRGIYGESSVRIIDAKQCLIYLEELVNKVAEFDLVDWFGRVKLIDCICNFVLLSPEIGQRMIEKLLLMLRDSDFRVRFFLGKQIGVLFQTWDGHGELFQDIWLGL